MKHSTITKFVTAMVLAVLINTPLYALCEKERCGPTGPPGTCTDQLLYDNGFDQSCQYWYKSNASIVHTQYDSYAKFSGTANGWVQQEVFVPTSENGQSSVITLWVDVVTGSPSDTGKLYVDIREPDGTLLETAAILTATSADGIYDLPIDDYDGFYVKLHFRYKAGTAAGTTEFRVSGAHWFVGNF
jgi:hypothetical protein